jgi:hypothetical protein
MINNNITKNFYLKLYFFLRFVNKYFIILLILIVHLLFYKF